MKRLIVGIILTLVGFNAQAAVITHGGTLPDSSQKSDFYAIIDSATISGIVNADVSSSAAIVASKLDLSSPGTIGNTAANTGKFTTLLATGNVGFGSTSPSQALDVTGTVRATNFISTGNVGVGSAAPGSALDVQGTVRILGSGNVGVGTPSPAAALDVTGDIVGNGAVWQDYSATSTVVGWASFTNKQIYYKRIGKTVFVSFSLAGTSNSTSITFTVPFTAASGTQTTIIASLCKDNSSYLSVPCECDNASPLTCYPAQGGGVWTASGTKTIAGQFWYQTT